MKLYALLVALSFSSTLMAAQHSAAGPNDKVPNGMHVVQTTQVTKYKAILFRADGLNKLTYVKLSDQLVECSDDKNAMFIKCDLKPIKRCNNSDSKIVEASDMASNPLAAAINPVSSVHFCKTIQDRSVLNILRKGVTCYHKISDMEYLLGFNDGWMVYVTIDVDIVVHAS